ncbi:hypothetical protein DSL72_007304 [Monilinia vaccinii-corymbosi]|uniref:Uncharacterized protein n=1 Tax=Monilinia vaccinii-corymbosi TaxID=61207 RepID=A0A8A3PMM1_9HELO|nr:hypothetical protein DSL72_007304 [Monilinia vaccinii-corymbosi]
MPLIYLILLFQASWVDADPTDVTNNLFSDIGPLLALFGDNFAQQFLRESFTGFDYIIFAMAPLGILTAIVSAIRVAGFPWMKAVIGRARENKASAELELMSSTSHEVCELWNGEGLVRTMGSGRVKQIIYLPGSDAPEKCLFTLTLAKQQHLMSKTAYKGSFKPILHLLKGDNSNEEELDDKDASNRAPNISLNVHPKQNRYDLVFAATTGVLLQVGVLIFSGFVAYNGQFGQKFGGSPQAYAFPILATGTAILVLSMGLCAFVIGGSTDEFTWQLKTHKESQLGRNKYTEVHKADKSSSTKTKNGSPIGNDKDHGHKSHLLCYQHFTATWLSSWTNWVKNRKVPEAQSVDQSRDIEAARAEATSSAIGAQHISSDQTQDDALHTDNQKAGNEFFVFWLQKRFIVSDQSFSSFLLMAKEKKQVILTSCRTSDPMPTTDPAEAQQDIDEASLSWLNYICMFATTIGIIGFVLQFEGFRGISWACSIAQLVAVAIMTMLRAYVRRGMLDRPLDEELPQSYEMDWLSLRIGYDSKYLPKLIARCPAKKICPNCATEKAPQPATSTTPANLAGGHQPSDKTKHICNPKLPFCWAVADQIPPRRAGEWQIDNPLCGDSQGAQKNLMAQKVLNIRKRLKELTEWSEPSIIRCATSAAEAIEQIMAEIDWPKKEDTFCWKIDVRVKNGEKDKLDDGSKDKKVQNIEKNQVQLSVYRIKEGEEKGLWKVEVSDIEAIVSLWMYHLYYRDHQNAKSGNNTKKGTTIEHPLRRVLGPWTENFQRELAWWIGPGVPESLKEFRWSKARPDDINLGFKDQGLCAAVTAKVDIELFLAQHVFSTFMWAISNNLPNLWSGASSVDPPDDDEVKLGGDRPNWNALQLSNEKIRKIVQIVKAVGLGSREDAHLLVIPPLSCSGKLPNECVVTMVRDKAKSNEGGYQDRSSSLYDKLLKLCDGLNPNAAFVYSVITTVVDALVTAASASVTEDYNAMDDKTALITAMRKRHRTSLMRLRNLYREQNRLESFQKAGLLESEYEKPTRNEVNIIDETQDVDSELVVNANGQTKLHRAIISKEEITGNDQQLEKSGKVADILGWTPLHYAIIYDSKIGLTILNNNSDVACKRDLAGRTPLHYAVMQRNENKTEEDLWKRLRDSIAISDYWGSTSLHFAAWAGNLKFVKLVSTEIDFKFNVDAQDRFERTALHIAIEAIYRPEFHYQNQGEIVDLLLKNDADVKKKDEKKNKPLRLASLIEQKIMKEEQVSTGSIKASGDKRKDGNSKNSSKGDILKFIIQKLLEKENLSVNGGSLLREAVKKSFKTQFDELIKDKTIMVGEEGVDPSNKRSILHIAAEIGSKEMVDAILKRWGFYGSREKPSTTKNSLERSSTIDLRDKDGATALMLSVDKGSLEIFTTLIDAGANGIIKDNSRCTIMWRAIINRGPENASKLLGLHFITSSKQDVDPDEDGITLLYSLVDSSKKEKVKRLLEYGVDPNQTTKPFDNTPLCLAVEKHDREMVELLLDNKYNKADIEKGSGTWSRTPLCVAAEIDDYDMVKLLLDRGASVSATDVDGWTPLRWCDRSGDMRVAQILLERGATADQEYLNSLLLAASDSGNSKLVALLLKERSVDIDTKNSKGQTALMVAIINDSTEVIELLLNNGAKVNEKDYKGNTALIEASLVCSPEIVKRLLEKGAQINEKNLVDVTPLSAASNRGSLSIVEMILDKGAAIELESKSKPLIEASSRGHLDVVEKLLGAMGDKEDLYISSTKSHALLSATRSGHLKVAKILLDAGADINSEIKQGETPLLLAVIAMDESLVIELLSRKADTEKHPKYGRTPLQEAAASGHETIFCTLLDAGADPYGKDIQGRLAFHIAAEYGNISLLRELIERQGITNEQLFGQNYRDKQGRNVLHHAPACASMSMISYLLELGNNESQLDSPDSDGWTPLHWAAQAGDLVVAIMLLDASADPKDQVRLEDTERQESSHIERPNYQNSSKMEGWTPKMIAHYNGHMDIADEFAEIAADDPGSLPPPGTLHRYIIVGIRSKCKECDDFDFCEKCMITSKATHPDHEFLSVEAEQDGTTFEWPTDDEKVVDNISSRRNSDSEGSVATE